jgi:hypothetical protein
MLRLEGEVRLVASDGEVIVLDSRCSGVKTGWAFIGNPYFHGDPDWRFKDGDTCIGCGPDEPGAMLVADAYQELRRRWDEENAEVEAGIAEMEARHTEALAVRQWDEGLGHLYAVQDALMGF